MIKVLIADDEPIIRLGLREKVNWEELGFRIVGEASNGVQAFQLTQELKPDVVLTDMKMPVWDGIQLLKAYEEHQLTCKVIVISAYSNFLYTQSAIKHGAFDYILKPIDRDELEETLIKIKQAILNNSADIDTKDNTQFLINAREQFLSSFLETDLNLSKFLDSYNTNWSFICIAVSYPFLPNYIEQTCENHTDTFASELLQKLQFAISPFTKDDLLLLPVLSQKNAYVFYIILRFNPASVSDLTSIIDQIQAKLELLFRSSVSLGVSNVFNSSRKINSAISQAMNALSYRTISNSSCVISYDCIPKMYTDSLSYSTEAEHTFLLALEICNYEEVERNIQKLFVHIRNTQSVSFRQVYKLITGLLFLCERVLRKYHIDFDELFSSEITSIDYIAARGNLDELETWFLDVVDHILDLISSQKQSNINETVSDIRYYIDNHYWEDINLSSLSKRYHINKSYLSEIFKTHTGKTYVEYLSTVRLNRAADILTESPKYKIHEIAQLVGYVDANYFSKCFKKRFGCTPEQYRNRNKN